MRWLRRVLLLGVLLAVALVVARRRRPLEAQAPEPAWPAMLDPTPSEPTPPAGAPTWVAPVDGRCPEGYPVKANDDSGIYHVPGGRFYDRTIPERCYATSADAERDGYRAAKA